jgi:hypothetical protein
MSLERYFLQVVAQDGQQRTFAMAPFLGATLSAPETAPTPTSNSLPMT